MDIRQRLLAAFEIEHKDHLTVVRAALRALEEAGTPPDLVEIHRRAHSLKGAARAVDLPEVEALAHRLEAAFIAVQKGQAPLDQGNVALLRRALDTIEDVVAWSTRGGAEVDIADVMARLDRMAGEPAPPSRSASFPAEQAPVRPAPGEGGSAGGLGGDRPSLVRIGAQGLERLSVTVAALLPEVEAQAVLGDQLRAMRQEWRALERAWRQLRPQLGRQSSGGAAAFERRFQALGTSLISAHRIHDRQVWSMRRWSGGLQEDMRRLRMLPAESQFGGLGRMIRDIARSQGKEVEVDIRGLEVEADRAVLQRLKDPILHIARNAVSHGIEPPDERVLRGKRPAARIHFEVSVEGGRLRLRLEDDGRGLDLAAIARQAVARGLLTEADAAGASLDQLIECLFEPGFSTAVQANELAGRGMGLPIARAEVERLQGSLTVSSGTDGQGAGLGTGQGTGGGVGLAVTIDVPLSLLSQRLILVTVGGEVMAVPSSDILRLSRVATDRLFTAAGRQMIRLEEEDLPVTSLAALLRLEETAGAARRVSVLVTRSQERRLALTVERFVATRDAVVVAADEIGLDPGRYLGTVLLDDGSPALVLNLPRLVPPPGGELPVTRPMEEAPRTKAHILVVDDSITTRTLEKSILESHGYRVTLCVDGLEALERLTAADNGEGVGVDLIVSDVEMPRMDGFALLQAVKADRRTAEIPVVLVTSRASDEDRERGLTLGADAYIVKSRFDQNELLAGIRRLL